MKKVRGTVAFLLVFVLSFSVIPQNVLAAKKKVKLSKKSVTVTVGKTVKVKLKNNKKKVKWTVTSGMPTYLHSVCLHTVKCGITNN